MTATASLIDDLEQALASGSNEQRIQTLARVTDLFIAGAPNFAEEHIDVFDDVILRIASRIEAKTLARLSSRLATVPNAPSRVAKELAANDDIEVARAMLVASPRLEDADLIATARTKSQQHLLAITERTLLSEAVTDVLVERGDREVVKSVVRNKGARFSDSGMRTLVNRAHGDDELTVHVGMRRDLSRHHMLKLIERASASVREKLTAANPQAALAVKEAVAEVVGGIRDEVRNSSSQYNDAKAKVAALYKERKLSEAELYNFARDRKFEETAVTLSLMANIPIDVVERALLDHGSEIIIILGKVAGLSWTTTKAIMLMQAADRGISAQDLEKASNNFNKLQLESARRVLGFYHSRRKAGNDG